jgi:predicted nucleotidyltransferase component of viral defense system
MTGKDAFRKQVQLLLQVLPSVDKEDCFALKGGTAINLFVRDLPRLSVDIDLVYLPVEDRNSSLRNIKQALDRIAEDVQTTIKGSKVTAVYQDKQDALRLIIESGGAKIKVELSPVLRGTVYEPERREVSEKVEDEFGYTEVSVVNLADLYAGKICAALDRQHPRDLFDVHLLLANEGLTEEIRKATLVYLISHQRPIAELLEPNRGDITSLYNGEFVGMAEDDLPQKVLEEAREDLIKLLHQELTSDESDFLLSFKSKEPKWSLLGLEGIDQLPAVRWKLQNLEGMRPSIHRQALTKLEGLLTRIKENWDSH